MPKLFPFKSKIKRGFSHDVLISLFPEFELFKTKQNSYFM